MANAKIVDIKGVQWELKDEVARNRITELEQKKNIKITSKIDTEQIKMNLIEIDNEKFIQIHFNFLHWSGTIGEIIASFKNDFGFGGVIRFITSLDLDDYSGRIPVMIDVLNGGQIRAFPLVESVFSGQYKPGSIIGDAFLRIEY